MDHKKIVFITDSKMKIKQNLFKVKLNLILYIRIKLDLGVYFCVFIVLMFFLWRLEITFYDINVAFC